MKSIDFPGAYLKIGEGQEQYDTIHALPVDGEEGEVISVFELTDEEVAEIVRTKKLFYSRLTFKQSFQPFRMSAFPIPIKVKLLFSGEDESELKSLDAFVCETGVEIPGHTKTPEGKYVKND